MLYDFPVQFLDDSNFLALRLEAEKVFPASENPIVVALWEWLEKETVRRREGRGDPVDFYVPVIELSAPEAMNAVTVITQVNHALAAKARFRAVAFLTELVQLIVYQRQGVVPPRH